MGNEHVTSVIARRRLSIVRNNVTQETQAAVCKNTPDSDHCSASAGFGLSWQILHLNDEIILDRTQRRSELLFGGKIWQCGREGRGLEDGPWAFTNRGFLFTPWMVPKARSDCHLDL
jgi:hypothetical protein